MADLALEQAISIADLEQIARQRMDVGAFDYCAGGSEDEITLRENVEAFRRKKLLPRALVPVDSIDLSTSILGRPIACPLVIGPTGLQQLAHPDAEVASARAAARLGIGFCLSTFASKPLEEVAEAAQPGLRWFQLYITAARPVTRSLVERAEQAGYQAIAITVDVPRVGRRERDIRNNFRRFMAGRPSMLSDPAFRALLPPGSGEEDAFAKLDEIFPNPRASWADVEWVRSLTRLPIVVKGILRPEDARRAVDAGAAGVVVSNHGGRQLGRAPATIEVLPEIVAEVGQAIEVYLDSGVRRGTDALIALALGARAVLLGRAIVWGLAAGGEAGVIRAIEILREELTAGMMMVGAPSPRDLNPSFVR